MSELVLVVVPVLEHSLKEGRSDLLLSLLGLSLTLSFRPFVKGLIKVVANFSILSFDDREFVVHKVRLIF